MKGEPMLKEITKILKMHCLLREDGWECEVMNPDKCGECMAKHLINHGVSIRPAVPGCDDKYNLAEMAFHNGEARMKEKMVDMLMGMQVVASGEKNRHLQEILERVKGL